LSEFEDERIVLNLEQRPQKTYQILNSFFDGRRVKNLFCSLFGESKISSYSEFLIEMVNNPLLFDSVNKKYFFLLNDKATNNGVLKYLYKYPTKSIIEDFYISTKSTKNSKTMQQSSQFFRKNSSNF
jgi:hypothetical protein